MSNALSNYLLFLGMFTLLAWSCYLMFRVGQMSILPMGTMLIGAYFAAYGALNWQLPFPVALVAAAAISALVGFLLGIRVSKLPIIACGLATIMLLWILQAIVNSTQALGGMQGLAPIPILWYVLPVTWFLVLVVGVFIYRLENSRFGRATEVIQTDPRSAESVGINTARYIVLFHTITATIGGLVGVLYAFGVGSVVSDAFTPLMGTIFVFIFLGGVNTMWGVFFAAPILWAWYTFLPAQITAWRATAYGAVLIIVMVFLPNGVITKPVLRWIRNKFLNIVAVRSKKPDNVLS